MNKLPVDITIPEEIWDLENTLAAVKCSFSDSETSDSTFTIIPEHVDSAVECARHQIQCLLEQESYSEYDEDALDDGFFLCDLNVVFQKLLAWRKLFPRIKPFYAIKCNPDPMVAAILGLTLGLERNKQAPLNALSTPPPVSAAGFDCASIPEIELALQYVSSRGAVYANPQRAEHDLDTALRKHQVRVLTFDGPEELYKIHRSHQQEQKTTLGHSDSSGPHDTAKSSLVATPHLVLRILVPDEHSVVPLGEKFGAPPDRIPSLVRLAMELQLPIIGVSFHCGSGNHDPDSYVQAIRLARQAMQVVDDIQQQPSEHLQQTSLPPKCWLLDIGGGYPGADGAGASHGRFSGKRCLDSKSNGTMTDTQQVTPVTGNGSSTSKDSQETAANIAMAVTPLIEELFPSQRDTTQAVHIISEPGRYFVEEAFCLCSRIYRIQVDDEGDTDNIDTSTRTSMARRHYYIAQGVQGVFKDCVLCNETFTPTPLKMASAETAEASSSSNTLLPSTVHGPSGKDYDVICPDLLLPELVVGDWLVFDCMGAYTLSIAARSGRPTVRYVVGGGAAAGEPTTD